MAQILVVDDENNIRLMVRIALQAAGHVVETAADGSEGLEKFGDGAAWDVILLDQRMPDIEGLEVLRQMRQRDADARIIMITAFGTIDLTANAMQAGALNFLRKPFTTEVLRGAVQAALDGTTPNTQVEILEAKPPSFTAASINGYRIEPDEAGDNAETENATSAGPQGKGPIRHSFLVRGPASKAILQEETPEGTASGEPKPETGPRCTVYLPEYFIELVKAHADREELPNSRLFWQWLCEESLANYLWQHAEVPPGGVLQVDELTTGMRRWVDAMLAG